MYNLWIGSNWRQGFWSSYHDLKMVLTNKIKIKKGCKRNSNKERHLLFFLTHMPLPNKNNNFFADKGRTAERKKKYNPYKTKKKKLVLFLSDKEGPGD